MRSNPGKPILGLADPISREMLDAYRKLPSAGGFEILAPSTDDPDELRELLGKCQYLVVRRRALPAETLAHAPLLRHVIAVGSRVRVDERFLANRNVLFEHMPRLTAVAVAELAVTFMLVLNRALIDGHNQTMGGAYVELGLVPKQTSETVVAFNWMHLPDRGPLLGKQLGLIGMGENGSLVAERAVALGMRVSYFQRARLPAEEESRFSASYLPLPDLLERNDFVSIHVPDTAATRSLIGRQELARMKPTAYLINTSRGHVVDEAALVEALARNRIAGAALDVFHEEPLPKGHPLTRLPNVVLTPHIGGGGMDTLLGEMDKVFKRMAQCL